MVAARLYNRAKDISPVEPYRRRFADLKKDGETWRKHWAEIAEYEYPRRGRWLVSDSDTVHETVKYSDRLLNNTPLDCRRIVASGLHNGLTPSSREWYGIQPENEALRDNEKVNWWLSRLKKLGFTILNATNFYSEIYSLFDDVSAFGTTAMLMEDDDETVLDFCRLPVGSYWPGVGKHNKIDKLYRRFALSAEALAEEFGYDVLPNQVKEQLEQAHFSERTIVIQAIQPVDRDDRAAPEWATYESVYFTEAKQEGEDTFLARRYYRVKPFVVFRWTAEEGAAYGSRCPGMDCLGDCQSLQALERKSLRGIDVTIDPPLLAPESLFGHLNRRPGTVTWTRGEAAENVKPLFQTDFNVERVGREIERHEARIRKAHYNDLFVTMLGVTKQMTAEESRQRAEEKTTILGPMIERFQFDLLEPFIDRLVDAIMFNRLIEDPPEELQGNVKYTYSGPLALIQKMMELGNIQQWIGIAAEIASVKQDAGVLDRVDADEVVEIAAEIMGIEPSLIVSYQEAKKMRDSRTQQLEQAAQMQNAMAMAQGAETLSRAQVGGQNGLEAALGIGGEGAV